MLDKDGLRARPAASLAAARAAWHADQTSPQAPHDRARVLGTAPVFALGRAACREAWAEAAGLLAMGLDTLQLRGRLVVSAALSRANLTPGLVDSRLESGELTELSDLLVVLERQHDRPSATMTGQDHRPTGLLDLPHNVGPVRLQAGGRTRCLRRLPAGTRTASPTGRWGRPCAARTRCPPSAGAAPKAGPRPGRVPRAGSWVGGRGSGPATGRRPHPRPRRTLPPPRRWRPGTAGTRRRGRSGWTRPR